MCGRIDQNETVRFYADAFAWADAVYSRQSEPRYNISPKTFRAIMDSPNGAQRVGE